MMDRPLYNAGNTAWRITVAIGIAQGKKIFCFPWKSNSFLRTLVYTLERIAAIIKENGGILLLPTENDELVKHFVDDVVDLSHKTYYEIEELKKMSYEIEVSWDEEAGVWCGVCDNIPLALESNSLDVLVMRVKTAAPEILSLNGEKSEGVKLCFKMAHWEQVA